MQLFALRERIEREMPRNGPGAAFSTESIGGWSRLGARLDGVLRAVFETLCAERGIDPAPTWHREQQAPYDRVTAGAFAHVLTHAWAGLDAANPMARALLADLRAPQSALRDVIGWRNALVHERSTPRDTEVTETLVRLRALVDAASRA